MIKTKNPFDIYQKENINHFCSKCLNDCKQSKAVSIICCPQFLSESKEKYESFDIIDNPKKEREEKREINKIKTMKSYQGRIGYCSLCEKPFRLTSGKVKKGILKCPQCSREEGTKRLIKIAKENWKDPDFIKKWKISHKKSIPNLKKYWDNNPKKKVEARKKMQALWQDPKRYKKYLKAISKRPTRPEKIFDEITPDIVRYTGNRVWWRKLDDGKNHNPDFKISSQNKVIEIWGNYWHKNEDPQKLINLYKSAGLECLIFWESEIYEQADEVKEKVNNFLKKKVII